MIKRFIIHLVQWLKAQMQARHTRRRWRQFEQDMAQFEPAPLEDSPDEL